VVAAELPLSPRPLPPPPRAPLALALARPRDPLPWPLRARDGPSQDARRRARGAGGGRCGGAGGRRPLSATSTPRPAPRRVRPGECGESGALAPPLQPHPPSRDPSGPLTGARDAAAGGVAGQLCGALVGPRPRVPPVSGAPARVGSAPAAPPELVGRPAGTEAGGAPAPAKYGDRPGPREGLWARCWSVEKLCPRDEAEWILLQNSGEAWLDWTEGTGAGGRVRTETGDEPTRPWVAQGHGVCALPCQCLMFVAYGYFRTK
jgi:hypothetical protein